MTDLHQRLIDGLANTPVLHTPPGSGASQSLWDDEIERVARALLPVIAAHEAETISSILDRIDALHKPVHRVFSWAIGGIRTEEPCPTCSGKVGIHECGCWADEDRATYCAECSDPGGPHTVAYPCPTRELTDAIRQELTNA